MLPFGPVVCSGQSLSSDLQVHQPEDLHPHTRNSRVLILQIIPGSQACLLTLSKRHQQDCWIHLLLQEEQGRHANHHGPSEALTD